MTFSRSHTRQMPRNRVLGRLKAGEMNKTESAYAEHLKASQIAGEVALWWFECIGLKVAAKCHYYPDFMVLFPDGRIEIHEVKPRNSAGAAGEGAYGGRVKIIHFPYCNRPDMGLV